MLCANQALLPLGMSDLCNVSSVQLYCPKCEDVYTPKSARHAKIVSDQYVVTDEQDGAYFGASFPHILLQVYPGLLPSKNMDRYVPKIFGFRVHGSSEIHRKQDTIQQQNAT